MMTSFLISSLIISILAAYLLDKQPSMVVLAEEGPLIRGQRLYRELMGLNRICLASGKSFEPTRYKFFTSLVDELLITYKRTGANIFGHLFDLRQNLLLDLNAEKKLKSIRKGAWGEMAVISSLGMAFVAFAKTYAGLSSSSFTVSLAFAWQALGGVAFYLLQKRLYEKTFRAFWPYIKACHFLDIYLRTGRPVNYIAQEVRLDDLPKDASLEHLRGGMEDILRSTRERGGCGLERTKELAMESWFCHERKLEEFMQGIKRLKLAVIALFFLSSYLFIFHSLLMGMYD